MNSNSNPKRPRTSPGNNNTVSMDAVDFVVNPFTEDILPEILDNVEILSAKDLLNFRLVSRCWRDAATAVLLKHNMCEMSLGFGDVTIDEDGHAVTHLEHWADFASMPPSYKLYKYFNSYQPSSFLSGLNQLISTSPKFPSTSICFRSKCPLVLGNLCPPSDVANLADAEVAQHQIDMHHFLSLYGKKIQKLSLSTGFTGIPAKAVQNLLYHHMPHLICIDLQDFVSFSEDKESRLSEIREDRVCLPPPSTLELREILMGHDPVLLSENKSSFVQQLIWASPNLSYIRKVTVSGLRVLHEMEKLHLINDFHFHPVWRRHSSSVQQLLRLVTDTILNDNLPSFPGLQLTKLKFDFTNQMGVRGIGVIKNLNLFLSASKDSLEYLQLAMAPSDVPANLFIPPLPRLKYLKLVDNIGTLTRIRFLGDVIGRAVRAGQVPTEQTVFDLEALTLENQGSRNISTNYFPRLCQVVLHQNHYEEKEETEDNPEKMLEFFFLDRLVQLEEVPHFLGNTLVLATVTTLKLSSFPWDDEKLPKIFPNVVHLKLQGICSTDLRNGVWTTFPKLENMEISTLQHNWDSKIVDSFFTGISKESCKQFECADTLTQIVPVPVPVVPCPAQDFDRTQPYIGDCENLGELKINFEHKLNSKFASKATALYGFQDVIHRTKIIFSFESLKLKKKEIQETSRYLDPVAAHVEIRIK